jgi:hypothetical protein
LVLLNQLHQKRRKIYRLANFWSTNQSKKLICMFSGQDKLHIHATYKSECSLSLLLCTNQIVFHVISLPRSFSVSRIFNNQWLWLHVYICSRFSQTGLHIMNSTEFYDFSIWNLHKYWNDTNLFVSRWS